MIVTDMNYALENRLVKKLDLMIERCSRDAPVRDAWLINEGGEGEGKTNSSIAEAYYIKFKTGRPIHLEFRLKPLIDLAKIKNRLILIWDEPAFDSLKADANTKMNKDLSRLLQTCRMKQHFLIINMTRFYRFNESLVVDRCLGLVHMYSRKEIEPGRFAYIKKNRLETLYRVWNSKHLREYKQNASFRGAFPEVMGKHFDKMGIIINGKPNCTLDDYNKFKDDAISSIGEEEKRLGKKESVYKQKLDEMRYKFAMLPKIFKENSDLRIDSITKLAKVTGFPHQRILEWSKMREKPLIA